MVGSYDSEKAGKGKVVSGAIVGDEKEEEEEEELAEVENDGNNENVEVDEGSTVPEEGGKDIKDRLFKKRRTRHVLPLRLEPQNNNLARLMSRIFTFV